MPNLRRRDRVSAGAFFLAELGSTRLQSRISRVRQRTEERLEERLSAGEPAGLRSVDRIGADDLDLLHRYHRSGTPVVIEGLYDHWPASELWTMAHFRENFGERRFQVNVQNPDNRRTDFSELRLDEIIDSFTDPDNDDLNYIMFSPVLEIIPELKKDLDLSVIRRFADLSEDRRIWVKLFFGPAGTQTSLHMAPQSNLFFQVHGKKRWVMFPPDQSALIYPNRILPSGLPYFFSNYRYRDSGVSKRYPLARFLEGYDIYLDSGDALWVPPFHWHWVNALTPSISLSSWWYDPLISLKQSPFFFALSVPGMLGILSGKYDVDAFDEERTDTINRVTKALRSRLT